jgi:hypothetical protein
MPAPAIEIGGLSFHTTKEAAASFFYRQSKNRFAS